MGRFLWVCLGSGVGGGARYLLSGWVQSAAGSGFPWGTFSVNVIGSFLIAIFMYAGVDAAVISPTVRLALTTGLMGGFTTYSTFNYETMKLLQSGAWASAVGNIALTVVTCMAAGLLGWAGARWLLAT